MKIVLADDGLRVSGRRGGTVRFAEIVEVTSEKLDKVTYEEVFLIVREQSGNAITLGELDEGFAEAEQALRAHLPGFSSDWWTATEQRAAGVRTQVWPTPA